MSGGMNRNANRESGAALPPDERRLMRPESMWSDLWRAPLHDFPLRDEILYQYLPLAPDMDLLEVGPGAGFTAFRLARQVRSLTLVEVAVDCAIELRNFFARTENVRCITRDASRLWADREIEAAFDGAYALDVFEYLPDPAAFLGNMARALRPGGQLLVSYPNVPPPAGDGVTWVSAAAQLQDLLRNAGFNRWSVFAVRPRVYPRYVYQVLHEDPLSLYRRLRDGDRSARPQTYAGTWAFRHRRQPVWRKTALDVYWAALGRLMRLGGDIFHKESANEGVTGKQIVIQAWR